MPVDLRMLDGVKVLDLSEGIAGPFCAKLLTDLGADTVKVERPETGDVSRGFDPFPDARENLEQSGSFFFLNTGKKSVVLDVDAQDSRPMLEALVQHYDVVIGCERLTTAGITEERIHAWNPRAVFTSVTGFGNDGPYSRFLASHLVVCAMGGWAQLCGIPEREPLQTGGAIAETLTGAYAAAATLLAVIGRTRHGGGEFVDASIQQAVLCGAQIPSLLYEFRGIVAERYSSVGSGAGAGYMLPTSDGFIGLNALTLPQWHMLCQFLDRVDVALDERYQGISWAQPDARLEEVREIFREALEGRSANDLFHEAQTRRVPFGLVPDLEALFAMTPHLEREFFQKIEHPVCGEVEVPGVPFKSTLGSVRISRPPLLGEHTKAVLEEIRQPASADELPRDKGLNPLPLDGLRVLDLSMFFAGPSLAQILADAGAEVIKVESIQRIDGWRGSGTQTDGDTPSWESSPYFNWINRNKRDVTLNLKDPRGTGVVKTLARKADILIENFTPRVMAEFGLDYDELRSINPKLIMISLSGFGADVSWRDYVAFGMSTEQMSGVAHLTGYEGGEPLFTGMTGGDLFSGVMGAVDVLSALIHRERTGEGQHLDFSQIEACNLFIGDVMTGFSLSGFDPGRQGNRHPGYALQGTFPCREDGWIAISCKTTQQLKALCNAAGIDAGDADLEAAIGRWTSEQNKLSLMHELQGMGVPAGAVLNGPDLLSDAHLMERGAFLAQDRPGVGVLHYPAQPYRLNRTVAPPELRAPLLGEHIEEVLGDEAGLTSDEIVELVIDDVTGTVPLAAR